MKISIILIFTINVKYDILYYSELQIVKQKMF